jgi:hypothetical protein
MALIRQLEADDAAPAALAPEQAPEPAAETTA